MKHKKLKTKKHLTLDSSDVKLIDERKIITRKGKELATVLTYKKGLKLYKPNRHFLKVSSVKMLETRMVDTAHKDAMGRKAVPSSSSEPVSKIIVGFDCEFVNNSRVGVYDDYLGEGFIDGIRKIVSYQFWLSFDNVELGVIIYPENQEKLKFNVIIGELIKSVGLIKKVKSTLDVLLVSHFGLVDFSCFKDFKTSIMNRANIHQKCLFTTNSFKMKIDCGVRNYKEINFNIRDTMLLGPSHSSLANLGVALGVEKLTPHFIDEIDKWKEQDENSFISYSLNDGLICVKWIQRIYGDFNDLSKIPFTIGNEAANFAHQKIKELNGWNDEEFLNNFLGLQTIKTASKKEKRTTDRQPLTTAGLIHVLANKSYYGGRNECYSSGIFKNQTYDYDLKGAYIAALALLEDPDFTKYPCNLSGELNARQIDPLAYGFGHVRFEFPEGVLPCLPVKDEVRGLIFPRTGETYACNPEIYLALTLGARIWVLSDYKLLSSHKEKKSFREVAKIGTQERESQVKGSALELSKKERNNSWYGKLGQGLREKKSYDSRYRRMMEIGESKITNPVLAAHVTSLVRALISGTMSEILKRGYQVHSVTTDGFILNIPFNELEEINIPVLTDAFKEARVYVSGKDKIWEIKHSQEVLINIKTRANVGLNPNQKDSLGVFAAGSFSLPREIKMKFKETQRVFLAEKFLLRSEEHPVMSEFIKFPSVRKLVENEHQDFVSEEGAARVNYEWDWKRKPINPRDEEIEINGVKYTHLTFETEAWESFEEFQTYRDAIERRKRTVKTTKDLEDLLFEVECSKVGIRNVDNIERTKAIQILRNIRAGKLPLNIEKRELLGRLNEFYGLTLTRKQWNEAGRADRQKVIIDPMLLINDIKEMELV